jgi:DNA polymerase sigma
MCPTYDTVRRLWSINVLGTINSYPEICTLLIFIYLFIYFCFFETGFLCVALAALELTL